MLTPPIPSVATCLQHSCYQCFTDIHKLLSPLQNKQSTNNSDSIKIHCNKRTRKCAPELTLPHKNEWISCTDTLSHHHHLALWCLFGLTGGHELHSRKNPSNTAWSEVHSGRHPYPVDSLNTYRLPTSTQTHCSPMPAVLEQCKGRGL